MLCIRKKSMFFLDFLNIGKDLISNWDKNKDKEVDKDKLYLKNLELISFLIDEDVIFFIFVDEFCYKREEKRFCFSWFCRKFSWGVGELKDGIAFGFDIDFKRVLRYFFKEFFMLEFS